MSDFIQRNTVAGFHYTLKNDKGDVLEKSTQPLEYLHGFNNLIIGLEKELEGMQIGDTKFVTVLPTEGYGEFDPQAVYEVPSANFPEGVVIEKGMQFQTGTEQGTMVVIVKEVKPDVIVVDGNHPMAGMTLHFDVEITSLRTATPQELQHGHVHAHGHDH